jgi:hypothetical protein
MLTADYTRMQHSRWRAWRGKNAFRETRLRVYPLGCFELRPYRHSSPCSPLRQDSTPPHTGIGQTASCPAQGHNVQDGPCMPTCVADRLFDHDGATSSCGSESPWAPWVCEDFFVRRCRCMCFIFKPWVGDLPLLTGRVCLITHTSCFSHSLSLSALPFRAFTLYKKLYQPSHLAHTLIRSLALTISCPLKKHSCHTRLQLLDGC